MKAPKELGVAVCAQRSVKANCKVPQCMEFALVWDMPVVQFGNRKRDYKRYTNLYFWLIEFSGCVLRASEKNLELSFVVYTAVLLLSEFICPSQL